MYFFFFGFLASRKEIYTCSKLYSFNFDCGVFLLLFLPFFIWKFHRGKRKMVGHNVDVLLNSNVKVNMAA